MKKADLDMFFRNNLHFRVVCTETLKTGGSFYMHNLLIFFITLLISSQTLIAQSEVNVTQKSITTSTGNDVDDCAIWVHPTDPSKSLVIVNDKGPSLPETAGLYVYTLTGKLLQKTLLHNPQNPDIRYNVVFGKDTVDVLVCADREAGNSTYNKIRVFKIDPSKAEASSGLLTEITASVGIPTGQNESYGHSLYLRPTDGALFSIVSGYGKDDFTQIRLESDGTGKVKGSIVRKS
jgi:3-phytase